MSMWTEPTKLGSWDEPVGRANLCSGHDLASRNARQHNSSPSVPDATAAPPPTGSMLSSPRGLAEYTP